jgi:tetratricopeptide (TPR) repeat protein
MSQAVYERYKDALRRGHVAALRGQVEAALSAYGEAAAIAPERALPHVGIGGLYQRVGRPADALVAFEAALSRAPRDEAALAGAAEALQALSRPVEAAARLDLLAGAQEADGRPADALATSVLALSLAESRERRAGVRRLLDDARAAADLPDAAGETLAQAERLLEGQVDESWTPPIGSPSDPIPDEVAEREPELPVDARVLEARAEAAIAEGDPVTARDALVAAADALADDGLSDAALDACYRALALDPTDPSVHHALVRRYRQRGWDRLADDKLALLARLDDLASADRTRPAGDGSGEAASPSA